MAATDERSLVKTFAQSMGMQAEQVLPVLAKTIFPSGGKATPEQTQAFLIVANQYKLNPFTREIYAFPAKGGGVVPVVGVDGWLRIVHSQEDLDGIEYEDHFDENGNLQAITCRIFRKGKSRPFGITEYLSECSRDTDPWRRWPHRMLRHKATIQCARIAYSISGIVSPDEAERMQEVDAVVVEDDDPLTPGRHTRRKRKPETIENEPESPEPDATDKQPANATEPPENEDTEPESPEAYRYLYDAYDTIPEHVDAALLDIGLPPLPNIDWRELGPEGVKLLGRAKGKIVTEISDGN